jgi:hypothetical protein
MEASDASVAIQKLKEAFHSRVKSEALDLSTDPDFPYEKDDTFRRFLVARNFVHENAMKMLWETTLWRYVNTRCE